MSILVLASAAFTDPRTSFAQNAESINNAFDEGENMRVNNASTNALEEAENENAENILNKSKLVIALQDNEDLPHPKSASRWRTRELITIGPLPEQARIDACIKETLALGNVSPSAKGILSSVRVIADSVRKSPSLYHWCFYYWMVSVDERLELEILSKNYEDKLTYFVENMKGLWMLARALDRELESKKYFGYLRRRYLEISQGYFGRPRQVISLPLGDDPRLAPDLDMKEAIEDFDDF